MAASPTPALLQKLAAIPPHAGVSVISPASFAASDRAEQGMQRLHSLGLAPRFASHTQTRGPMFFAGTPAQRLEDLHSAFADPATHIVASIRGGYGSNYLLDALDLDLLRLHPKPFFAYSDLTAIQLHLLDRLGLPAFHGPMVAADLALDDGVHLPSFHSALAGTPYALSSAEGIRTLKPGTASGTLYGGCLSIIVATLGTPWEPQTEGKLLFLEDIGVKPYQVDRMLWQLRHSGKLNHIRGIIFGEMLNCSSPGAPENLLDDVILHAFSDLDIPIVIGLRSGHVSRQNVTLTLGVAAELRASTEPQLHLLEPAVK